MNITIIALGSRGDVEPYLTLGQALQSAGHTVQAGTFQAFEPMVSAAGLRFFLLPGDAEGLLKTAISGGIENTRNIPQMVTSLRRSYGMLAATLPPALLDATRGSDLILNQLPGNLFGPDLAEYFGIPLAVLSVIPLLPTRT